MYVERNNGGTVISAWSERQYPTQAALSDDDPALFRYMQSSTLSQKLAALGLTVDDVAQLATRFGKYVDRDERGLIIGAWDSPQRAGQELARFELPELQRFLALEPEPAAPEGYSFLWVGGDVRWRVLRLKDNTVVVEGLDSVAACASAAGRFASARRNY